ncbi:hypothetical protein DIURU_001755 [Diutina rugosa]|uniref:Aminopeptidase P N-terminal domain-containing protein n=1 Tax=Diutina rugosa TaxID=5481 RepID=A0A642UTD8_DIURU|nr:uncharacterized protein DIURU_001755 [Diutina rugosa]KAA8904919.1 hypothetical protein DIURU_001755 [Diutina rugosa]
MTPQNMKSVGFWGPKSLENKPYPAKEHAQRVADHFKRKSNTKEGTLYVAGAVQECYSFSDSSKRFRQERYFFYLTGCETPGSHVTVDVASGRTTLYLADIDEDDIMWSGYPISQADAAKRFHVDEVKYAVDLKTDLEAAKGPLLTVELNDMNSQFHDQLTVSQDFVWALDEARLIKDEFELELMRYAAAITDNCHRAVMEATKIETNECHIHAEFMYHALRQGSKAQSYDPVCCAGPNCSTLHYVTNDDDIDDKKHSVLIDAGAEWMNYTSDVTRCFPINGTWTKEHLDIYNAVLRMQSETMAKMKPGQSWDELHLLAHRILIDEFLKLGIFKGDADEIFANKVSAPFFPHGLGHVLGLDTHDVGGEPNYDDADPLLAYLRLRRPLQQGMVVTNEPGIYFSPFLLEKPLKDETMLKYINKDVVDKYWYIGGVRIEDDIVITKDGYENLTKITSDPVEIEKIVKKGLEKQFHNVV